MFLVKYKSDLTPKFTWIDEDGKTEIKWTVFENKMERKIAYHDPEKKLVALIIRNCKAEDSGTYKLKAENAKIIKEVQFELNVRNNLGKSKELAFKKNPNFCVFFLHCHVMRLFHSVHMAVADHITFLHTHLECVKVL